MKYQNIYRLSEGTKRKRGLNAFAEENRKNPTPAEERMAHLILDAFHEERIWCLPVRQHIIANNWILDIYFPEIKLGIEVDGDIHDSPQQIERDQKKHIACEKLKIKLMRFTNHQVLNDGASVIEKLVAAFPDNKKLARRKRRTWPPRLTR
jgi:very-short-patch-repair endonuclease